MMGSREVDKLRPDVPAEQVLPDGVATVFVVRLVEDESFKGKGWEELAFIGPEGFFKPLNDEGDAYRESAWEVVGTQKEIYGDSEQ